MALCIRTTGIHLTNDVRDNFPLAITNNGDNLFQGEYIANANNLGCPFRDKTNGSATYWWSGIWGANTNGFNIWFNYPGLSLKSHGSAAISGNLNVGVDAVSSIVKAYVNHEGSTCSLQLEARWRNQAFTF